MSDPKRTDLSPAWEEDEIDVKEIAGTLWENRRLILSVTAAGALLSGIVSFSMPNVYTATATIMPIDSSNDRLSSTLSALGALGGLASQAGVNLKGSVSDKFVALLKSRTVTDNVISKHHLMPVLFADRWDPARGEWKNSFPSWLPQGKAQEPRESDAYRALQKILSAPVDPKTGLVSISVDFKDPQVAAEIANGFVIELNAYLQRNSFSSAKRNRDFLEKQVNGVLRQLGGMESALKSFQEQNKLVSLDAQTEASVQAYAALKSQLTAKEMELSLQSKSVSSEDVELIGLKQEIAQLKEKIGVIEHGDSGGWVAFKDAPRLGMRFAELKRDLLVKQKVFELLTQQLELAKVDEAKETLSFQILDKAIAPDRKSKPHRLLNILMVAAASFLLAGYYAVAIKKKKIVEEG